MRRPDPIDLGIVAAAGAVSFATTDPDVGGYAATLVFGTALLTLLGLMLRLAVASVRAAYGEQRRARELQAVDAVAAARQAVQRERVRLSGELDSCIREALEAVREELTTVHGGGDPQEAARRIHRHAREATSELRRQLGLLRDPGVVPDADADAAPVTGPRSTRRAMLAAGLVAVLAGLENWGYFTSGQDAADAFVMPWSPLLTAVAACTLVGWRVAPVPAAAALAVVFVVPRVTVGVMVGSGAWMVVTLGCLTWALAVRGPGDRRAVAGVLLMAVAAVGSRLSDDAANAAIVAVLITVTWTVGSVVGWNRRRRSAAVERAAARQAELDRARESAVHAERLAVARELHDVVSHAVGVIAVQAAAAEVSWPRDPRTTLRALETIDGAASDALAELGRVVPDSRDQPSHDLDALVERIRATGTAVRLTRRGTPAGQVDAVAYRVVQEGLTNAVRHAPGAPVDVLVDATGDELLVRVADDGPGPGDRPARGFGLVGLAERVTLQGGTLRSGPGPHGHGFAIEAVLPHRREESG